MLDPICEPVLLEDSRPILVDLAHFQPDVSHGTLFYHFHDVAELVLFGAEDVEGIAHIGEHSYKIEPNSVFYLPSMYRHGFDLKKGQRNRLLIFFDPDIAESLANQDLAELNRPVCCKPDTHSQTKLDQLGLWLLDADRSDPEAHANKDILRLMLRYICEANQSGEALSADQGQSVFHSSHRLDELILRMKRDPGENLSLEEAAGICCLSPAYFSKTFKNAFGMNFVKYRRSQKLRIAARRLSTTGKQVAQIGYELGFASPSHFVSAFKEQFGVTPQDYRQKLIDIRITRSTQQNTHNFSSRYTANPVNWVDLV